MFDRPFEIKQSEWATAAAGSTAVRRERRRHGLTSIDGVAASPARDLYRELYEDAPCGHHTLDANDIVRRMNATELGWLGYRPDEVLGRKTLADLIAPQQRAHALRAVALLKAGGRVQVVPCSMLRKDGTTFPALLSARGVHDADGRFVEIRASVVDISELASLGLLQGQTSRATHLRDATREKWAEKELHRRTETLRFLSRRLVEVQETERRRLAGDLHDVVGQNLSALSINLNILRGRLSPDIAGEVRSRLDDSLHLVDRTIDAIRDVMTELRPAVLDDYGLTAALRWYTDQFGHRTGVLATQEERGTPFKLPAAAEEALFRIAQEALINAAKYSGASRVSVSLDWGVRSVCLTIADTGRGFEVTAPRPSDHVGLGLALMHERAAAVGARLEVQSAPGKGTRVVVTLES